MGFINWWFPIGIVLTAAVVGLIFWLRQRKIELKWWEWLIGFVGLLMLLLTIQTLIGAVREQEAVAVWKFAMVLGLPTLILLLIPSLQIWRRSRSV
jgi:uncharacterized membrane protein